jgi:hypothetical protein
LCGSKRDDRSTVAGTTLDEEGRLETEKVAFIGIWGCGCAVNGGGVGSSIVLRWPCR